MLVLLVSDGFVIRWVCWEIAAVLIMAFRYWECPRLWSWCKIQTASRFGVCASPIHTFLVCITYVRIYVKNNGRTDLNSNFGFHLKIIVKKQFYCILWYAPKASPNLFQKWSPAKDYFGYTRLFRPTPPNIQDSIRVGPSLPFSFPFSYSKYLVHNLNSRAYDTYLFQEFICSRKHCIGASSSIITRQAV